MSAREFLDSDCKNDNFCFHCNKPKFQCSLWWCANRRVIFVWEILWTNGKSLKKFPNMEDKMSKIKDIFCRTVTAENFKWFSNTFNDQHNNKEKGEHAEEDNPDCKVNLYEFYDEGKGYRKMTLGNDSLNQELDTFIVAERRDVINMLPVFLGSFFKLWIFT